MYQSTCALMDRCLRVDNRSLYVHGFRCAFLLFVYLILLVVSLQSGFVDAAGLGMFSSLSYLNLFFILAANLGLFCSAITEEKEEMTLGLLKMAGIRPVALLLGKCIPRLVTATTLLLAELPFVMLCVTLGGVSLSQIAASFACLLGFLLLNAGIGLFCSVVTQRTATAAFMTMVILFSYWFGPFLVGGFAEVLGNYGSLNPNGVVVSTVKGCCAALIGTNAFVRMNEILFTGGDRTLLNVQTITNTIGGIAFFGLAWMAFARSTKYEVESAPMRMVATTAVPGQGRRRWRFRGPGRVWDAAIMWKDFHFTGGGRLAVWGLTALYVGAAIAAGGATVYFGANGIGMGPISWETVAGTLMFITGIIGILQVSFLAARIFADEVQQQTLSALVMLPQPLGRVLWGKVCGSSIPLLSAVGLFMIGGMIVLVRNFNGLSFELFASLEGVFVYLVRFVGFLHLTAWLSLYIKWGALPLGFVAYIMMLVIEQMFMGLLLFGWFGVGGGSWSGGGMGGIYLYWMVSASTWIVGTLILQRLIVRRIRQLAAQ